MSVLVVTDMLEGAVRPVNHELFTSAHELSNVVGAPVVALLMGPAGVASHADVPAKFGIERVAVVEDGRLAPFSPDVWAAAISDAARQLEAKVVLMAATFTGKDLMARAAQRMGAGLAQDCMAFRQEGDGVVFHRPMYAGKVRADVRVTSSPAFATLRPKAYKPVEQAVTPNVEMLSLDLPAPKVVVESYDAGSSNGRLDVTEADIVVSGGRGMQGPEHWGLIEGLADALGAATGCTRPVSDDGWRPHEEHIGQTGKTVSPDLYVACGVSGAIQHVAGISSSKYILAINKDPDAPIFKVADYGIVGDVFEVLPAMTEAIKTLRNGS